MTSKFRRWWKSAKPAWWNGPPPEQPKKPAAERGPMKVSLSALLRLNERKTAAPNESAAFRMPEYAPGVLPDGKSRMAMDDASGLQLNAVFGWGAGQHGLWAEGIGFAGYPYLASLTQRPEYRIPSEVMAEEMTRKWIVIKGTGTEDKTEKVKRLTAAMERYQLRKVFRDALELEGFMGLSFIHIDLGTSDDPAEMGTPLLISRAKIGKGKLKGFRVVDPTWTAPNRYNSINPLDPTFYKPQIWFVMGVQVHVSRLLPIISRPLPDIMKPAYNFGGLSLSQMLKPYVDNWLRTRQSVSDLLNAFTVWVLETNMLATLQGGGGEDMDNRLGIFTALKNNRGVMAIDKESEALSNVSAPLGTLDALQAQTQEHMAAVAREPFVKLFGITPSGLNATSDGEIRSFYDTVHGRQERVIAPHLKTCLDVIQLSEFGSIDPELTYEFVPLWQLDEAGKAAVQKTKADTAAVYAEIGAVDNEDIRTSVAADPDSQFFGLEGPAPEMPDPDDDLSGLGDPSERIVAGGEGGSETGANSGV